MNNDFQLETNSVWSFKDRGSWSTHKGDYPGNWSPYIPRNIILRYSNEQDVVLDQFLGSGTTMVEVALLNRKGIGYDINHKALNISLDRIDNIKNRGNIILQKGDACKLNLNNESVDLICTHPPYANIIKYSNNIVGDISLLDMDEYYLAMEKVARECFRVLKREKYCAILIGDTRRNGFIVPIGFNVLNMFLDIGFKLKEIVIKEQHNCKSTEYWKEISLRKNFLLIAHEYLFIFKKYN